MAKTLTTISYKSKKGIVKKIKISLKEFKQTYKIVKRVTPSTPPIKQFYKKYIRYRIGLEHAYNDTDLVKSPAIKNMFANSMLQKGFEQILYKTLAEKRLNKKMRKVEKQARNLSKKTLLKMYKKNPEFNINFITIYFPKKHTPKQIKEAYLRVHKIYKSVKRSKKSFAHLIDLYSDDKAIGKINVPHTRNTLLPILYNKIITMKNGEISAPIKTQNSFYIIKLKQKMPLTAATADKIRIRYFTKKREQSIAQSFDQLKSIYKITLNHKLFKTLR